MRVVRQARIETWQPDFPSWSPSNPTWTRVAHDGVEICNSLESVEWSDTPTQVVVCTCCGFAGCAIGGYVHATRLEGDDLLWTAPQPEAEDVDLDWWRNQHATASPVTADGALLVPSAEWSAWRHAVPTLPAAEDFPCTNGRALEDAWRSGCPERFRAPRNTRMTEHLRASIVATNLRDVDSALARLTELEAWFEENGEREIRGRMVPAAEIGDAVDVVLADEAGFVPWASFVDDGRRVYPLFDSEWGFMPLA